MGQRLTFELRQGQRLGGAEAAIDHPPEAAAASARLLSGLLSLGASHHAVVVDVQALEQAVGHLLRLLAVHVLLLPAAAALPLRAGCGGNDGRAERDCEEKLVHG